MAGWRGSPWSLWVFRAAARHSEAMTTRRQVSSPVGSMNRDERVAAAKRRRTPPAVLVELARAGEAEVRWAALANPSLLARELMTAVLRGETNDVTAVLRNPAAMAAAANPASTEEDRAWVALLG